MIFKLESFIKVIRWKIFFYEKSDNTPEKTDNNFGFKSVKTPPKNEHLNSFEADFYMIWYETSNLRELLQNSKVTCQKISNALMKTRYFLFLLTKQATCISFLMTIITNY